MESKFKVGDKLLIPAVITEIDVDAPEYKLHIFNGEWIWATKETLNQQSSKASLDPSPDRAIIAAIMGGGLIIKYGELADMSSAVRNADALLAELQKPKP